MIGIAGLYKHLIRKLNDDVSTKNYSGFGNKDMPGFFSEMFSDVIRDTCDWVRLTLYIQKNCSIAVIHTCKLYAH